MNEITQVEAEHRMKQAFGPECKSEVDNKQTALKCWLYKIHNGWTAGMYGGRTWADALKEAGLRP